VLAGIRRQKLLGFRSANERTIHPHYHLIYVNRCDSTINTDTIADPPLSHAEISGSSDSLLCPSGANLTMYVVGEPGAATQSMDSKVLAAQYSSRYA
jgi:hypothetical protein